jgi:hypothetical protein
MSADTRWNLHDLAEVALMGADCRWWGLLPCALPQLGPSRRPPLTSLPGPAMAQAEAYGDSLSGWLPWRTRMKCSAWTVRWEILPADTRENTTASRQLERRTGRRMAVHGGILGRESLTACQPISWPCSRAKLVSRQHLASPQRVDDPAHRAAAIFHVTTPGR